MALMPVHDKFCSVPGERPGPRSQIAGSPCAGAGIPGSAQVHLPVCVVGPRMLLAHMKTWDLSVIHLGAVL